MPDLKEKLQDLDFNKIIVTVTVAQSLIEAGYKIMDLLKRPEELTEEQLLEIIAMHDEAKESARAQLVAAIKAREEAAKEAAV